MLFSFGKGEQIELRAKRDRAERGSNVRGSIYSNLICVLYKVSSIQQSQVSLSIKEFSL
jgi:hypothetical protein